MKQNNLLLERFQSNQKRKNCQQNPLYKYVNQIKAKSYSLKKINTHEIQYSFKPNISQIPIKIYPSSFEKVQLSRESQTQRLIENNIKKEQINKMLKLQEEQYKFQQNCTFKPQINQKTNKILKQRFKTEGQGNVYNRLYSQSLQNKFFENIKNNQIQCSFKPTINPTSLAILNQQKRNLDPIHKRLDQILKEKREKRKNLQEFDKNKQKQMMFVVNNQKTKQIIQSKTQLKEYVLKRLFSFNQKKKDNLEKAIQLQKQKNQQLCPFKPTIFPNDFINSSPKQFLQRQKMFEQKIKQNRLNLLNQEKSIFRPQINKISDILTRQMRQNQTILDKCNRLHYQNQTKQQKLQEITQQIYKQCTFQPKINQISKAIDCCPKSHSCKCQKKQQSFQFKPKICQKSRQIINNKQNINKPTKEEQIQKIKMEKQYKQLIQCTFKPQTNKELKKYILSQGLLNAVRGTKQFMNKVQQIKQKKIQEQDYKEKIFNLEKKYRPKSFTKIQQFKLSQVDKYKKRQKLRKEMERKQRIQCTFKPVIHSLR